MAVVSTCSESLFAGYAGDQSLQMPTENEAQELWQREVYHPESWGEENDLLR